MKSKALAVVLAAGIVRLVVAAFVPLFPDEAYFWDWSRHLAAGYFDHPPMVALLIRLGTTVFGDNPFGVRVGAVLAGIMGSLAVTLTARRLGGDRAALVASLVLAAMPLTSVGLVLATSDAGMIAATSVVIYAVVRALENPAGSRQSLAWWCIAGLAQGIAFWAKYTAILVPAGVGLALLLWADLRHRLREPGPYLATLIASLVFAPVLVWNAQHDWISLSFQVNHGLIGSGGSILRREAELVGGQLGVVSPILFVIMAAAVMSSVRAPNATPASRVLGVSTLLAFAVFVYSATQRRVEANWPAIAYLPATVLLATHAKAGRWLNRGLALGLAMTAMIYIHAFVPILPLSPMRDPTSRASGWRDLASVVQGVRDSLGQTLRTGHQPRTFVAGNRYQEAGQLAFLLEDHPETFALNVEGRPNQYDLWPGFDRRAAPGDNMVLVVDDIEPLHPATAALIPHFRSVARGAAVPLVRNGNAVKHLRIWTLTQWRGTWPSPPLRSRP